VLLKGVAIVVWKDQLLAHLKDAGAGGKRNNTWFVHGTQKRRRLLTLRYYSEMGGKCWRGFVTAIRWLIRT
jgi:hypothetical protein